MQLKIVGSGFGLCKIDEERCGGDGGGSGGGGGAPLEDMRRGRQRWKKGVQRAAKERELRFLIEGAVADEQLLRGAGGLNRRCNAGRRRRQEFHFH
jgi:hypothetical protein